MGNVCTKILKPKNPLTGPSPLAKWLRFPLIPLLTSGTSSLAHAHPGHTDYTGFSSGFTHPLFGLDHLIALLAVGLWAAQLGGRAVFRVPLTFVLVMILGAALGCAGVALPFVEAGILTSVLVLGLMIARAKQLPLHFSLGLVGLFALFHGNAHGLEMPATASSFMYFLGFAAASALLHAGGIALASLAQQQAKPVYLRYAGVSVMLGGVFCWLA